MAFGPDAGRLLSNAYMGGNSRLFFVGDFFVGRPLQFRHLTLAPSPYPHFPKSALNDDPRLRLTYLELQAKKVQMVQGPGKRPNFRVLIGLFFCSQLPYIHMQGRN